MSFSRLPRRWSTRLALCAAPALAVALLLVWLHLPSLAQPSDPTNRGDAQTVFTWEDGLAADSVTALLREGNVLWVGTTRGLNRYSLRGRDAGLEWQTLTSDDGLAVDAVGDLWTDDAGGLWVAHPKGQISYFDGALWMTYNSPTETLRQAYQQIVDTNAVGPSWAIEGRGRAWTLDRGTVGYYVGGVWRPYGEDSGIPRGTLVAVWADEGAWVASENGQIGFFDGTAWTTFRDAFDVVQRFYETLSASGPSVRPLWLVDRDGGIWVRNGFNQRNPRPDVRRYADGRWTNFNDANGMARGFVAELRLDAYGRVWARHLADAGGQGGGLSVFDGENWSTIVPAFSGNVTDFAFDGADGVWIGSAFQPEEGGVPVGGLTYVAMNTWQRFSLDTLAGAAVGDVWLDENDELWLGLTADARQGLSGGLWRYRPPRAGTAGVWMKLPPPLKKPAGLLLWDSMQ